MTRDKSGDDRREFGDPWALDYSQGKAYEAICKGCSDAWNMLDANYPAVYTITNVMDPDIHVFQRVTIMSAHNSALIVAW
jgi:hypothetical protein